MTTLTEAHVLQLLRDKHSKSGNGGSGEYAFLTHVRSAAGFDANRTFDAVAVSLWPSRGLALDVFEVKVSRSDWQRELSKPAKAEDACAVADRFWIVAPAGAVRSGELPPKWGLIEVTGDGSDTKPWKLRTKTSADWLHEVRRSKPGSRDVGTFPRGLVVGMLRSAPGAVPGSKVPGPNDAELTAARMVGFEAGRKAALDEHRQQVRLDQHAVDAWARLRDGLRERDRRIGDYEVDQSLVDAVAAALDGRRQSRRQTALLGQLRTLEGTLAGVIAHLESGD